LLQLLQTNRSDGEVTLCIPALLKQTFVKRGAASGISKARIGAGGK
jgi:hypothetical protein